VATWLRKKNKASGGTPLSSRRRKLTFSRTGIRAARGDARPVPARVVLTPFLTRSAIIASIALSAGAVAACATSGAAGGPVATASSAQALKPVVAARRITESQYRHSVQDIFGDFVNVTGRFEPERRDHGLFAIGSKELSISTGGFEQYFGIARRVADQVFDAKNRDKVFGGAPASADAPDDARAEEFVRHYGRKLFRRPLTNEEVATRVALANRGATVAKSYDAGLKLALVSLMSSSHFLFREETVERDPARRGQMRLDGYAKAHRLSYMLWDTTPDEELLRAAEAGELHTQAGVDAQVERLTSSPRFEQGVRAFFTDMMQLDKFESLTKDPATYPKFSAAVVNSAREQTLKTMVDLLVTRNGDYRDIFTSRDTFMNRALGPVYKVPVPGRAPWVRYTYPEGADHAGVLTQVTFLAMFSHPGRSSPTLRGVALNEIFLCMETPLPPANVDFSIVNDTANVRLKTTRARLLAHAEDETCAGCHNLTDPIGLSLERFDSLGQPRMHENGEIIDVTAELDGIKFEGASGLGKVMRDNPAVPECIVRNVYAYGIARSPDEPEDLAYLQAQGEAFAASGYKFPAMVKAIASSPEFFQFSITQPPQPTTSDEKIASLKDPIRLAGGLK